MEVQQKMGVDEKVKYSIVHSYIVNDKEVQDEYFHLDKEMKVLGQLNNQQMMEITMGLIFKNNNFIDLIDSLGTDTTNIQINQK